MLDLVLRCQVFGFPGLAVGDCESVHQSRFDHVHLDMSLITSKKPRMVIRMSGRLFAAAAVCSQLAASWLFSSRRKALTLLEQCTPAPSMPNE
jgi:hypothetical protein